MDFMLPLIVGLCTGILSGFGIGGGSLLMLYLTLLVSMAHRQAACINLLYFLACAPAALWMHIKNRVIDTQAVLWCVLAGVPTCLLGAWLSGTMNTDWVRRGFGALLLYIGVRELFAKQT